MVSLPLSAAGYHASLEAAAAILALAILVSSLDDLFIDAWYWCRRLARWWVLIQLLFPAALLLTLALRLPPGLFLAAFLFLLLLYWSTSSLRFTKRMLVPTLPGSKKENCCW